MTKQEFIDKVHESAGIDVPNFNESSRQCLSIADRQKNFAGTAETRERAARDGRNPQTGKPMKIKASTTVAFRPATALKERVGTKAKAKAKAKAKKK